MPSIIVFPGQGSQFVGMCKSLVCLPSVARMFDLAKDIFKNDILSLCLSGPKEELDKTKNSQVAVFLSSMAALEHLKMTNPEAIEKCYSTAGFSIGEYASLVLANVITFEDGINFQTF
jgi:[acyl-carrier-protein] S-malonyltransferase